MLGIEARSKRRGSREDVDEDEGERQDEGGGEEGWGMKGEGEGGGWRVKGAGSCAPDALPSCVATPQLSLAAQPSRRTAMVGTGHELFS